MKIVIKQLLLLIKKQVGEIKTLTDRCVEVFPLNVETEDEYLKLTTYDFREVYQQRAKEKDKLIELKKAQILNSAKQQALLMQISELKDECAFLKRIGVPRKVYSLQERKIINGQIEVNTTTKYSWYPVINGNKFDQKYVDALVKEIQDRIRELQAQIENMNLETEVYVPD